MRTLPFSLLIALFLALSASSPAGEKKDELLTDQQFGRVLTMFLEDPLHEKGPELAKMLIVYTIQTPKAAVMLGESEMKWIGKTDDKASLLLLAAYMGGNTRSQLLTGVKQNDRYSGLVTLFAVYQRLQDKNKDFKIAEVDELRKLHQDGKLLAHVVEMEKRMPTKLSPEDEKAIKELLKNKKQMTQTVVPLGVVARHILHDFQDYRADELKRLGKNADAWKKTLDPAAFDHEKSWTAFVDLVGGNQNKPTEDALIAEIAMLYYLAKQDKQQVVFAAELDPKTLEPRDATVRLVPPDAGQAKVELPYHGMTTVNIKVRIIDNEASENGLMLWNRIWLIADTDAGPFKGMGRVIQTTNVWFGLPSGKEPPRKKSRVPMLRTCADDSKYEGGGIWDSAPADGKSFWVAKGWTKEMVPRYRWKER